LKDVPRRKGKSIDFKQLNRTLDWQQRISEEHNRLSKALSALRVPLSTCPICSCKNHKQFVNIYDYMYVECVDCGHIFSQAPPDEQAILSLYADESDKHSVQRQIYIDEELFKKRIEQIARPKVDYCSSIIPVEGLWVDLGCGTGELLAAAAEKGWQTKGIEADRAEIEFGRNHGLNIIESDIQLLNAEDLQNTKVLSLLNLLEHMRNPLATLVKLVDALPPEACVVIEVPRHPSLSSFVNLAFPNLAYRHIYAPDHLHIFTEKSTGILLEAAGLKPLALWEFGQDFQHFVSNAAVNAGLKESEFLKSVVDVSVAAQQVIDDLGFSDVLFIIARKK
jgi:SAM-dependent methyltransferase